MQISIHGKKFFSEHYIGISRSKLYSCNVIYSKRGANIHEMVTLVRYCKEKENNTAPRLTAFKLDRSSFTSINDFKIN